MKELFNPLLKETFVFRPFDGSVGRGITATPSGYQHSKQGLLRYADGQWIPDDGEYDLAFVRGVIALGMHLPDFPNVIWSWNDIELTHCWLPDKLHKYARGHHFFTVDNSPFSQDYHWDKSQHPNAIAMKSALDKACSMHGCGNGRGAYLTSEGKRDEPWLSEKRILIQSTMQPVLIPENPICYLCLDNGKGHLVEALQSCKEQLEADIEYAEEEITKAQSNIYDNEYIIEKANEGIPEVIEELKALGISL